MRPEQPFQHQIRRPAVAQAGQRVSQRLFLCSDPCTVKPQGQSLQFTQDSGIPLSQEQKFGRHLGCGKIGMRQGVIPNRRDHVHKSQVDQDATVPGNAHAKTPQRRPRPAPKIDSEPVFIAREDIIHRDRPTGRAHAEKILEPGARHRSALQDPRKRWSKA
jgi:hypothetical protein